MKPPVVIVGLGRLGGALARGLSRAGWPVSVVSSSVAKRRQWARRGLRVAGAAELRQARICFFTVPDPAVAATARGMDDRLGPGAALVHCAGAFDLQVFDRPPRGPRRPLGSFHPLCAISQPTDPLSGNGVAVAATSPTLDRWLRAAARDLGMFPIRVSERRRAAYHAGAVLSAGSLVALGSASAAAFASAGIQAPVALKAIAGLMRSALKALERQGFEKGLTGPVSRGDVERIRVHLAALPAHLVPLYRELTRQALAIAPQLPAKTRVAIRKLLK